MIMISITRLGPYRSVSARADPYRSEAISQAMAQAMAQATTQVMSRRQGAH
jgi:hypothetical protein